MMAALIYIAVTGFWAWLCYIWGKACARDSFFRAVILPVVVGLMIAIVPAGTFSGGSTDWSGDVIEDARSEGTKEGSVVKVLRLAGVALVASSLGWSKARAGTKDSNG